MDTANESVALYFYIKTVFGTGFFVFLLTVLYNHFFLPRISRDKRAIDLIKELNNDINHITELGKKVANTQLTDDYEKFENAFMFRCIRFIRGTTEEGANKYLDAKLIVNLVEGGQINITNKEDFLWLLHAYKKAKKINYRWTYEVSVKKFLSNAWFYAILKFILVKTLPWKFLYKFDAYKCFLTPNTEDELQ